MYLKGPFASARVRTGYDGPAIKTPRSKQCRIQNIRAVRRSDQNYAIVRFEPVHFDQQLIQSLFALIVTAAEPRAAMTANCVDLIDEDNARRVLLALFKQIANA